MIDHEQVLETLRNDLLAAGLDPAKHLATEEYPEGPKHLGRRCKECVLLYKKKDNKGKYKKWHSCRSKRVSGYFTGGEFACEEFEAKI